jgi:putative drug exporter of the RND superfamily
MTTNRLFNKLGRFNYRFRKIIIIFWVVSALLLGLTATKLPSILSGSGFETEGSFSKVEAILQDDFHQPQSSMMLIFESENYSTSDEHFKVFVTETLQRLQDVDHLIEINSPIENEKMQKEHIAYAILGFDKSFSELKESILQIRSQLREEDDIKVGLTGGPVIAEDMNHASQHDLKKAEAIGIPAALIILLLAFGSIVAASIPLLIGLISVLCSMGLLYFFGVEYNLSIFLLNVVPMIGLALGIDFALLLVSRFREELTLQSVGDAVIKSVETAGRSIAFSGICVFLGLSSMLFIQIDLFQTVAVGGMVVVIFSCLIALTFLPAVLGIIGPNINRFRILKVKEEGQSAWHRFAKFVMRRPVIMLLLASTIITIAIIPVSDLKLTIPEAESLPEDYESRIVFEKFKSTFGEQQLYPVTIIADSQEPIMTNQGIKDLQYLINTISDEKIINRVESIFSVTGLSSEQLMQTVQNEDLKAQIEPVLNQFVSEDKTILRAYLNVPSTAENAQDWVREWDGEKLGFTLILGGNTKFTQEIFDEIYDKVPYGLAYVLIATYFMLLLAFRSAFIPLKAIIMNAASLSATFGIIVWIFQEGHFVDPTGISLMIPVFTFGIVFGLSMDYEVFLISRIQEAYLDTKDNDFATLMGLTTTSKIITSAALIMIVVTGAFAFTGVTPVKQMGVSIALAIFIDATIVRMILVPSLMKLMGHWNWWAPKFMKEREREHKVS